MPRAIPAAAVIAAVVLVAAALPDVIVAEGAASGRAAAPAAAPSAFGGIRADTRAPVEVSADQLSVNQKDGSATFSGNVVIVQGDMRLAAKTAVVVYANGDQRKIRSLLASGGVTLVSGADAAEAQEARYDVEAGTVTLTGDVLVTREGSLVSGEHMVVDLADGTARMQGRVRSILQPDQP